MTSLHVIALISGGKDSLYSILHNLKHGHQIVALANLSPLSSEKLEKSKSGENYHEVEMADMDSYMYQTIGHSIIPLYEEALGIPLYRASIKGVAVNQAKDYEHRTTEEADETESMTTLLSHIMEQHPTANAVSSGAILSTYQRTRVESVAARLGLASLAWLWQYPNLPSPIDRSGDCSEDVVGLLADMAACGCDARIIKVACGGLDPDLLWSNVSDSNGATRRKLAARLRKFFNACGAEECLLGLRGTVLGEGGEYETLALNGPKELWKKRIMIEKVETKLLQGGAASLDFRGAKCVPHEKHHEYTLENVREPRIFDPNFKTLLDAVQSGPAAIVRSKDGAKQYTAMPAFEPVKFDRDITLMHGEKAFTTSNLSSPESGAGAEAQMRGILYKLERILRSQSENPGCSSGHSSLAPSPSDIVFTTILLRSMSDFAAVNQVYASLFTSPNPPARATIGCGSSLPAGINVMVSFLFDNGPRPARDCLHVQSRSYWAPANIGPYSQAIAVPAKLGLDLKESGGCVYVAGQVPLMPTTMEIGWVDPIAGIEEGSYFNGFIKRAVLSLQHLWRIGLAMKVDMWLGGVAYITGPNQGLTKAMAAWDAWKTIHQMNNDEDQNESQSDAEDTVDAWELQQGLQQRQNPAFFPSKSIGHMIPNPSLKNPTPPFFAVLVAELPKAGDIEWQAIGTRTSRVTCTRDYTTDDNEEKLYLFTQLVGPGLGYSVFVEIYDHATMQAQQSFEETLLKIKELIAVRIQAITQACLDSPYTGPQLTLYTPRSIGEHSWNGQVVPCSAVYGHAGRRLAAGIVAQWK